MIVGSYLIGTGFGLILGIIVTVIYIKKGGKF